MRRPLFTLFLACLSLALSVLSKPHFLSRRDRNHSLSDVLSWRQYRFPRDILDTCINADVDLLANAGKLISLSSIVGSLGLSTKIHLCLCLKDLNIYLETNDDIQALVGLLGSDTIAALIRGLINTSPDAQKCTLPVHAHRTCNSVDPCHWACDDHYVRDGNQCICSPPYVYCNGDCGLFPSGCPSAIPRSLKTRAQPILALPQAQAMCQPHESVCGIEGHEGSLAFECIDTTSTKDSCGGCVVQHSFREVEPSRNAYGQDCKRISNAHFVSCAESSCIVHSCKSGWVPDVTRSECIIDPSTSSGIRRVFKRSDLLSANVSATAVVTSDILTQLVNIVDGVLDLDAYIPLTASLPALSSTGTYVSSLLNDINDASAALIGSTTVTTLLRNVDQLLDTSSLLQSILGTCGCVDDLGLSNLVQGLDGLVVAVTNLRNWCSDHTIVSGPATAITATAPSATAAPEQPIIIPLPDLLAGLGLKGKSVITIDGLLNSDLINATNSLLNALGIGSLSTSTSQLLTKLSLLVQLVIKLQEASVTLPPALDHVSLVNGDLLTPLVKATANVLNSTTISSLIASLNEVVGVTVAKLQALDLCACVDELGLHQLYQDLKSVLDVASDAQTGCLGTPSSVNIPVAASISDLLTHSTPRLLASIKSATAIGGSRPGLSSESDNLLNGLITSPHNAKRTAHGDSYLTLDSDVLVQVGDLVKLVINLQGLTLSPDPCVNTLYTRNSVKDMANALTHIAGLPTCSIVIDIVGRVLADLATLQQVLQPCKSAYVEDLGRLLTLITEAAVKLGSMCGLPPTKVVPFAPTTLHLQGPTAISALTNHVDPPSPALTSHGNPAPHAQTQASSISLPSAAVVSPADDEIIIALNQLLSSLGLGSVKGVVTVGGLEPELNNPVNGLLDGLGIGPNGLRRQERRQIGIPTESTNGTVDSTIQTDVYALIDLVLGLVDACGLEDCSRLGTAPVDFVLKIVNATAESLTSKSWARFVDGIGRLVTASSDGVKVLDGCRCVSSPKMQRVYGYTWRIREVAVALQSLCQKLGLGKANEKGGHPIVVGLTKLMSGLEKNDAVMMRSAGVFELINQLLGIGRG